MKSRPCPLPGKLKLQPLSYVLKTFSLGQPETPHLDLALAHDMEVEDGDGQKERYKIGSLASLTDPVGSSSANLVGLSEAPQVTLRFLGETE